jgi:succinyl-CoA synthetase alpha subunit
MRTPVVAYIAGHHAPPGKRMGHAGALLASTEEDAPTKSQAFREAGAVVVDRIVDVAGAVLGGIDQLSTGRAGLGPA